MNCSKCGKNMTNEKGVNIIGVHMEVIINPDNVGETPEKPLNFCRGSLANINFKIMTFVGNVGWIP